MKRLLLSAAAMAVIAGSGSALADPNRNENDPVRDRGAARQAESPAPRGEAPRQPQFQYSAPPSGGGMPQHFAPQGPQRNFAAPMQQGAQPNFSRQPQFGYQGSGQGQRQWMQPRVAPGYVQPGQSGGHNSWNQGTARSWHTPLVGQAGGQNRWNHGGQPGQTWSDRDQPNGHSDENRNEGRVRNWSEHNQWNGRDAWNGDHDHDWWRGERGFERYEGRRDGYWFAPGWGYYRPDAEWYGYNWALGAFVPNQLWSYYVSNPYDYGLQPAPYGYRWIYLDNELVLIDLSTGEIVQIADDY